MPPDRKNIMLGTAGHVDHGKTALVKVLTGCDTDTLAAEKQRGLTIELGFAPCRMKDERIVGIVDVPGHVGFIRNMVAGAHGVDVVILVVAADDGVMPQTREHLDILTLMGVTHGLVALTKIDMVDSETRAMARDDVEQFVKGTFLAGAPICGVSNITGEGYDEFLTALNATVEAVGGHESAGVFRMWIERTFAIRGFGTVVSGIPTNGQVNCGDRLTIAPMGIEARARRMQVYGQDAEVGRSGECVAVNLTDVDPSHLKRGCVLTSSPSADEVTMFEAHLVALAGNPGPIKDYTEVHLHIGTGEVVAHIAMLEGRPLARGEGQMVQMRLARGINVVPPERFVVRGSLAGSAITTIAGGRVLGVGNRRLKRNRPWTLELLARRLEALDSPMKWCSLALQEAGGSVTADDLARRAFLSGDQCDTLLAGLEGKGLARRAPSGRWIHRRCIEDLSERIAQALSDYHTANPKRAGMDADELRAALDAEAEAFDIALEQMARAGTVDSRQRALSLRGHDAAISPEDLNLCDRLDKLLLEAHLAPPLPAELAGALDISERRLASVVELLSDQDKALAIDPKVILHQRAIDAASAVVMELFAKAHGFTTMEFRDALGVSRKYAVPLLDYFDSIKLTVRSANRRTPGARARDMMAGDQ